MTAKEMAGKKITGKSKHDPWPEEQVTSMASQHIGSIHHHLDQLMAQADLIAAYMPHQPVISTRPVVTLRASMIVARQEDEDALGALRQDIAQKQSEFEAYHQTYEKEIQIEEDNNQTSDTSDTSGHDAAAPQQIADQDNELRAIIRAYVIRCLEEEAPELIHKELVAILSAELDPFKKRTNKR